ncbi:MAG: alpha/beta hydrolase [Methanoregulaceae archaeon]
MATYVLVHGGNISTTTWNRFTVRDPIHTADGLLGGKCWDGTAADLAADGHRAFAPTLSDEHHSTLTDHIGQVVSLIREQDLQDVILVGHSYGGMVITGVAAKIPDRIRRLVYIDAALPDPGQSLFDIILAGGADPLSFAGLEPAPPYVEKLQFDPGRIAAIPKTYILCTKSGFASVTQVAQEKIAADGRGWTYIELPASHVPMEDMPGALYRVMREAGGKKTEEPNQGKQEHPGFPQKYMSGLISLTAKSLPVN